MNIYSLIHFLRKQSRYFFKFMQYLCTVLIPQEALFMLPSIEIL